MTNQERSLQFLNSLLEPEAKFILLQVQCQYFLPMDPESYHHITSTHH